MMLVRWNNIWLFLLLIIYGGISRGQEMLGTVFSNYSGINSALINPALMTVSKAYLDINVIGGDAFFKNDWGYIPKEGDNIWDLIKSDTLIPLYGKYRYNGMYTYYKNTNPKYILMSTRAIGPSAMIQTGKHAFGLSLSVRSVTSGNNIAFEIPVFAYEGLSYEDLQNVVFDDDNFDFVSLTWSEISGSWAYDFHRFYKSKLTLGVNTKLLLALEGAYITNKNVNYTVYDPKTIEIFNWESEIGFSLPINYDSNDVLYEGPAFKGVGVGFDIGFVYTRLKNSIPPPRGKKICSKPYEEYLYRIGISIIDLGGITFNKNTQKHNFDNVSVYWAEFDTLEYHNLNITMQQLSETFYGDPNQSKTDDKISIGLPTAISLQFEANLKKNIYLSTLWIQPIRFNPRQLRRPSQIALVPRYENEWFAFSLPLSMLQYKYIRLGAALRFGPLTIGTERLGILLGVTDLNGMDIYFSLKFSLTKGRCSSYNKGACYNTNYAR